MTTINERIKKIECLKAKRDGMLVAMRAIQQELVNVETELAFELVAATSNGMHSIAEVIKKDAAAVVNAANRAGHASWGHSDGKGNKKARKKK